MDLFNRANQFKNSHLNVFREANHRSLSYQNKCKLAKPLRVGQKVLSENHKIPFRKSQKMCELPCEPCIVTKVVMKVNYESALGADPTRTQVVHCNHLVEYFPLHNELPNLLSTYEKPFNDDKTVHFNSKIAKNGISRSNQLIDFFVEQHLND